MITEKAKALLIAFITTLLWSGSYIINKIAFAEGIQPLTLAGIRYTLAGIILTILLRKPGSGKAMPLRYAFLQGVLCYFIGQGFQYIGQSRLVPTLSGLILNSAMVVFVILADALILKETPGWSIFIKLGIMLAGMLLFYQPWNTAAQSTDWLGVVVLLIASFGAAMNIFLNRYMLVRKNIDSNTLTTRPMLIGGSFMLCAGLVYYGVPHFSIKLMLCIAYLAAVSGALAFFLWVWSQKSLSSSQSGAINSGMIIEIALMDVLFFQRKLGWLSWLGLLIVFLAICWIQRKKSNEVKN